MEVWIPDSARVPVYQCTVPGCGSTFGEHERRQWQQHVGPCARAHLDRIREVTRPKGPSILSEDFDPDVTKHLRGVGQRMLQEGRLEIKESEKAGF